MERIPILKMGKFLLVTIQVDMHDQLALTITKAAGAAAQASPRPNGKAAAEANE